MVTAALVAGVGAAGVSASGAGAAPGSPDATSLASLRVSGQVAQQEWAARQEAAMQQSVKEQAARLLAAEQRTSREQTAREAAGISQQHGAAPLSAGTDVVPPIADAPAQASAPVLRKPRPKPVVTATTAVQWVNPLPEASVTSCFGQRWGRLHAGVDLAAADGTRIRAAGAGTVVKAGAEAGYGNAVLIDHGNGYLTHYGHMSSITVRAGQHVAVGEEIGHEGSTGHSTGPHLHFEVHEGTYKNPIEPTAWMHEHGVDIPGCADLTADKAKP